jgi:Uma2 family endonuclease
LTKGLAMTIPTSDSTGATGLPPLPDYIPRLFTIADLAALPSELPSGPVLYELHHGRLITMAPPGDFHCAVETKFVVALFNQGEVRGLGKARGGEIAVVLRRNPDHVVGADAVFIANRSLPIRRTSEGYLETIPDLIIEVRSKNDTLPAIQRKEPVPPRLKRMDDYLRAGVRVVWVADPGARTVTEYRPDTEPRVFQEDDTLTVEDIIPGFQLPVRDALQD